MLKIKLHHILLAGVLSLLGTGMWSCRKDVVEVRPYPVSINDLKQFLQQAPASGATEVFDFNGLNEDKMLSGPEGVRVFLSDVDHLFSMADSPTAVAASSCSDLKIEISVAFTKGDILARDLGTFSFDDGRLLETSALIGVRAWCGGSALQLLPGRTLKIQVPESTSPLDDMFVYDAVYDADEFRGWKNTGQEVFKADWPGSQSNTVIGYEILADKLGWTAAGRPLPNTGTTFCADLQPGFTGQNTQSFLVFSNQRVVAPLIFDDASHSFCFDNVPAGYPVQVVSVAKLGVKYWLGNSSTETGTNTVLPIQSQQQDAGNILDYLRGL